MLPSDPSPALPSFELVALRDAPHSSSPVSALDLSRKPFAGFGIPEPHHSLPRFRCSRGCHDPLQSRLGRSRGRAVAGEKSLIGGAALCHSDVSPSFQLLPRRYRALDFGHADLRIPPDQAGGDERTRTADPLLANTPDLDDGGRWRTTSPDQSRFVDGGERWRTAADVRQMFDRAESGVAWLASERTRRGPLLGQDRVRPLHGSSRSRHRAGTQTDWHTTATHPTGSSRRCAQQFQRRGYPARA